MKKMWIVTLTTYLRQVKSWSFVILVLSPFIMLLATFGVGFISANSASDSNDIAVIAKQPTLRKGYIQVAGKDHVATKLTTVKAARHALKKNDISGYVILSQGKQYRAVYHGKETMPASDKAQLTGYLSKLQTQNNVAQAKLSGQQLKQLSVQPTFKQVVQKREGLVKTARMASFWILVFMVYMILTTYSSITAQEIASEKGTKVMEMVFSSTTAAKYFCGKILGVLMVIATQLLVYLIGGWASLIAAKRMNMAKPFFNQYGSLVDQVVHNLVNVNLLFLFLGVIIYTILAAFSGALVSKAEDASKAAYPAVYLSMIAFFATFPFQNNADALLVKMMSYVPFFSSYFMPLRIINQSASPLEIGISLSVLILTIIGLTWYISSIYKGLILQADESHFWQRLRKGLTYK